MRLFYCFLSIALLTQFQIANANQIKDFAKSQEFRQVKLSPDGKTIAATLINEDAAIAFFDSESLKPINKIGFNRKKEPGEFYWVNNERLVFKLLHRRAWREEPEYYGQLYAIDKTGERPKMIFGYNAGESNAGPGAKKRKVSTYGWGEIVDLLDGDKRHILVQSTPFSRDGDKQPKLILLDVYKGHIVKTLAYSPIPSSDFFTDTKGNLRLSSGSDENDNFKVYSFDSGSKEWSEFANGKYGEHFTPLVFDTESNHFYFLDNFKTDTLALYRLNLATQKRTLMFKDPLVDITSAMLTSDQKKILAIRFDPDYPNYAIVPAESPEHSMFRKMLATFPNQIVDITSLSTDGALAIVKVSSDSNPGVFYLYNNKQNKLATLFKKNPHINEKNLSPMRAIQFIADDGVEINGYLTSPTNAKVQRQPLVVMPHGGPHGVRDRWGYHSEVQALVSRGFAVLQVNFRGSGGYGREFYQQGLLQWGDRIQRDIIQSVKWAIKEEIAHPDRICIMGASFGAYSAVMSATIEPDLFQCVVANVGVYDLALLYEDGDVQESFWGASYLEKVIGTNKATLQEYSPINHVKKLKAKIFIAHGEKDERAPIEHAEKLKEALQANGLPFEWFVKETEGHGYYSDENRAEYLTKAIGFIEKNIGSYR
ncbi:alpha/beta hydrolase family protein [Aliikangiella marina]|nr:S9 family peptidase [Aliikangiella marina]